MFRGDPTSGIQVRFADGRAYPIAFRPIADVPRIMRSAGLRPGKCLVVTDSNVAALYAAGLDSSLRADGWTTRVLSLPAGEETKSTGPLEAIYDAALGWPIDRKTPVIALGGGVVGDLAGYAAATLLRGVPLVHVPTTLIAQVDSSIGGKTGINHEAGKNLVGAFYQPAAVITDVKVLQTLPEREWMSGMAEVIKHALIADTRLFDMLEAEWPRLVAREPSVISDVLFRAARVKVDIVVQDEKEAGRRAVLNFGHTFAHALERAAGYGTFTHGEAVALGMRAALFLSRRFSTKLDATRAENLVRSIPVPPCPADLAIGELMLAMRTDKKVDANQLAFILLDRVGDARIVRDIHMADVEAAWLHALS